MRTLIVSDIHGNEAALRAVLDQPHDALVCLGDIVGYGPGPAACVARIRAEADIVVLGNHDHALATGADPRCSTGFAELARVTAAIGARDVGNSAREWLEALPRWAYWTTAVGRTMGVHATPSDPLYRYLGPDRAGWAEEAASLDADLMLVGHTHLPFQLQAGDCRITNPGSVGLPKDGDPRPSFAMLEHGTARLGRTDYDVTETVAALAARHLPEEVESALRELLLTGRVPHARQAAAGP